MTSAWDLYQVSQSTTKHIKKHWMCPKPVAYLPRASQSGRYVLSITVISVSARMLCTTGVLSLHPCFCHDSLLIVVGLHLVNAYRVYDFVTGKEAWIDKMTGYFPAERKVREAGTRECKIGGTAASCCRK